MDSYSTISSILNPKSIEYVHELDTPIRAWTNSGHLHYAKGCMLNCFPSRPSIINTVL